MSKVQGHCHRPSPSVTAFLNSRSVTDCHRVSPSVTCARENLKAHLLILEAKGTTGLISLQIPQVTDGDNRCQS
jgi:hypothetical protein